VRVDVAPRPASTRQRATNSLYVDVAARHWDPVWFPAVAANWSDCVSAEVIYPTIGMFLYALPTDLKAACFRRLNRWIGEILRHAPEPFLRCGPTVRVHPEGNPTLRAVKALACAAS